MPKRQGPPILEILSWIFGILAAIATIHTFFANRERSTPEEPNHQDQHPPVVKKIESESNLPEPIPNPDNEKKGEESPRREEQPRPDRFGREEYELKAGTPAFIESMLCEFVIREVLGRPSYEIDIQIRGRSDVVQLDFDRMAQRSRQLTTPDGTFYVQMVRVDEGSRRAWISLQRIKSP